MKETAFKSYDPPRLSKSKDYKPGGRACYLENKNRILCCNCGQPYGKHYIGERCPKPHEIKRARLATRARTMSLKNKPQSPKGNT